MFTLEKYPKCTVRTILCGFQHWSNSTCYAFLLDNIPVVCSVHILRYRTRHSVRVKFRTHGCQSRWHYYINVTQKLQTYNGSKSYSPRFQVCIRTFHTRQLGCAKTTSSYTHTQQHVYGPKVKSSGWWPQCVHMYYYMYTHTQCARISSRICACAYVLEFRNGYRKGVYVCVTHNNKRARRIMRLTLMMHAAVCGGGGTAYANIIMVVQRDGTVVVGRIRSKHGLIYYSDSMRTQITSTPLR